MNVPKLRFKDENGQDFPEWEEKTLGEIAYFSKGKGISKADIDEHGSTFCIRYGELYTEYGETIVNIKSKTNISIDNLVLSEFNDVIIPASGETQVDIAKASCILVTNVALGSDLNIIKSKENGVFLSYYINNQKKLDIAKLAQGHSVVHLYASQLKLLNLSLPCFPEQTKIANFLSAVDDKISELTKKIELLQRYKKGAMQQIFSQQLRFKDDNGQDFPEWEEKTLGEVAIFLDAKRIPLSEFERKNKQGQYPYYGASGIIDYIDEYIFDGEFVLLGEDGANILTRNSKLAFVVNGKFWVNNHAHIMQAKGSNIFLAESLERIQYEQYNSGTVQPKLNIESCKRIVLNMPLLPEQTKIANFLSALDEQINISQQQLESSKQYKKSLLQQMFI